MLLALEVGVVLIYSFPAPFVGKSICLWGSVDIGLPRCVLVCVLCGPSPQAVNEFATHIRWIFTMYWMIPMFVSQIGMSDLLCDLVGFYIQS